jgi:hypothetical protein
VLKNCYQTGLLAYKLKDISYKSVSVSYQTDPNCVCERELVRAERNEIESLKKKTFRQKKKKVRRKRQSKRSWVG